jgi:hypothetical protein
MQLMSDKSELYLFEAELLGQRGAIARFELVQRHDRVKYRLRQPQQHWLWL